jgi:ferrous iron transport protein B
MQNKDVLAKDQQNSLTLALTGNPNVGKSTVFNSLTGLKQHTGNWTGKTVENAMGKCIYGGRQYTLMDLPGTYSIMSNSAEEELARDYLCFGGADAVIVVADATALERNLNLLFQIMEITTKVVLCLNLMDEAAKKQIEIDCGLLSVMLNIPVIPITATKKNEVYRVLAAAEDAIKNHGGFKIRYRGKIEALLELIEPDIERLCGDKINARFAALKLLGGEQKIIDGIKTHIDLDLFADATFKAHYERARQKLSEENLAGGAAFAEEVVGSIVAFAEKIAAKTVTFKNTNYNARDKKIDKILTSRLFGIPIMLLLLGLIFYITITLSNYPSQALSALFAFVEKQLNALFTLIGMPRLIHAPLMDGVYKTTAWVVAVMLPPMAIFFPLFTLLEDLGYLPRVAFNLDRPFKNCGCCGKQSLSMCMGFGCNAAGVVGTRIIDSPRERLIAIITNNFVPCNGRFPTLIAVSGFFIGGAAANAFWGGVISALALTGIVLLGIIVTFIVSRLLSRTFLKGVPSSFSLELPPFRRPQIAKVLLRSLLDRTIFVLGRAVVVAMPCGLIIWLLTNINIGAQPMLYYVATAMQPLGRLMGMDGYVLSAFVLGFPANEIVIPLTVMSYTASATLVDAQSAAELGSLLVANGWTLLTGINVLLFCLLHFPCATTMLTIKKETKSLKWTALAAAIPTLLGIAVCVAFTALMRLFGAA